MLTAILICGSMIFSSCADEIDNPVGPVNPAQHERTGSGNG